LFERPCCFTGVFKSGRSWLSIERRYKRDFRRGSGFPSSSLTPWSLRDGRPCCKLLMSFICYSDPRTEVITAFAFSESWNLLCFRQPVRFCFLGRLKNIGKVLLLFLGVSHYLTKRRRRSHLLTQVLTFNHSVWLYWRTTNLSV
jgi:hypothetical protein